MCKTLLSDVIISSRTCSVQGIDPSFQEIDSLRIASAEVKVVFAAAKFFS